MKSRPVKGYEREGNHERQTTSQYPGSQRRPRDLYLNSISVDEQTEDPVRKDRGPLLLSAGTAGGLDPGARDPAGGRKKGISHGMDLIP